MGDILITAVVDLADSSWPKAHADRILNSMKLGKGGDVSHAEVPGALLATRSYAAPLSRGKAPAIIRTAFARHAAGHYTLLAGQLHDRDELCAALSMPLGSPDSALYAAAWGHFGEECDQRVIGDYAAIVWMPASRKLRLSRSPMSNRPLHLWREGSRIVVSSNPRMIFATGVPSRIDDQVLADSLYFSFLDPLASRYAGLSRIGASHVVTHEPGGHSAQRFWSIGSVPKVRFRRDEDYVEATHAQLQNALKTVLSGAQSPAITLSGGLDSQCTASYAFDELPPPARLRSYTSVPMAEYVQTDRPWLFDDETAHVRAFADMYPRLDPTFLDAADVRFGDRLKEMYLLGAWPTFTETSAHWVHEIYKRAAADGCDVVLDAEGGNAGFSYDGATGFPTWLRQGQFLRLLHELRASNDPRGFLRKLFSLAIKPNWPISAKRAMDEPRGWFYDPFKSWCPLREDFARSNGVIERADAAGSNSYLYAHADAASWRFDCMAASEVESAEMTLSYELVHGIELRSPMTYRPLMELCMGFPDEQFLRGGIDRWLARRLLNGRIPEMVRAERRTGRQTADWPIRMQRERADLLAELERLQKIDRLAGIFDFQRMHKNLTDWPGTNAPADMYMEKIRACVGRGITAARFVNHVEGRNDG